MDEPVDQPLDLAKFETPIVVRTMQPEDFEAIIALQKKCFPGLQTWTTLQLESHLRHFPEGQILVEVDGEVVASASSLIVDFDEYDDDHTFDEISANGSIANHDPEGSDLYGIEVMVDPDYRGMRIGERLYEARKDLARSLNLRRILIAGRIPRYAAAAQEVSPREYVREVVRGTRDDPVLGFQLRQAFTPKRVLEGYLPKDAASLGHAVLLEWNNLDFQRSGRRQTRVSHPVRICVIQYQMRRVQDWKDFEKQTEYFVDVAANYRSDFAIFPELLTTQLLSCLGKRDPAASARELSKYTEDYIRHFQELAVGYNVNILAGTHLVEEDGELYNIAFLFKRDGTIEKQYKLHITPNERRWWGVSPGREIRVIDTDVGRVAINICYDVEFPEVARIAVDRGARMILVPYCTEDRQGHLRVRYCAQARAVENQIYVVTAGTVGNLPESENMDIQYAQSGIFTPSDFPFPRDGIQSEASPNVETVVVGDIDLEVLRRHRKTGSVAQLQDRRHDLYEVRAKGPEEQLTDAT